MLAEDEILTLSTDQLAEQVRHHNHRYWVLNAPEISDETFDLLVRRLRALAPGHPILDQLGQDSPEVAITGLEGKKVRHRQPMLSLEKAYSEDEIRRFFERFTGEALASPKVDGLAISLRYGTDGRLAVAATRGTGLEGDDVTAAALQVEGIPETIPASDVEIRGEVYMPLSRFAERYAAAFANPRNLAAGALKQKDPRRTRDYGLRFWAYDLLFSDAASEFDKRQRLQAWGFAPVEAYPVTADTAQARYDAFVAERASLDFETDGVVLKVLDVRQHDALGLTAHHPRYAIAWKYQGESGFTALRGVEWSVSRTGAVNPVALLEPVTLSGVTVSRVSLHNLGVIEQLAGMPLAIGDNLGHSFSPGATLLVTRRGGVIPHVESVAERGHQNLWVPDACPSCGAPTLRRDDFLHADHATGCAVQQRRRLEHFVQSVDMQGFGPKILEQLFESGRVRRPADLYTLGVEDLSGLERMGERSAQNLVAAVSGRRTLELSTLVAALGIPDVGQSVARWLANHHATLDAIGATTAEELQQIDGIGPIVAEKIVAGFAALGPDIRALMEYVSIAEAAAPAEGALAGASFVFTGALDSMSRAAAQGLVQSLGGTTPDGVTATTRFLVLGDGDHARFVAGWRSSKLKKADDLIRKGTGLEVISESDFIARIRAAGGAL